MKLIVVMLMALQLCAFQIFAEGGSLLIQNLDAGRKQVVVVYGTSLTHKGGWVRDLDSVLQKRFPGLVKVINSGGSGQWSEWGVINLEKLVLAKKPDTVFIEFAINDSVARFNGSVKIARTNLESITSRIRGQNPKCEIVLMTMTPGNKYPSEHRSYRKNIADYYEMYRQVAAEHGFVLIDLYPKWIEMQKNNRALFDSYVPDSIHPTDAGNKAVVVPQIFRIMGIEDSSQR